MFNFLRRSWTRQVSARLTVEQGRKFSEFLNEVANISLTAGGLKDLRESHAIENFVRASSGILPAGSSKGIPLAKHIVFSLVSGYSAAETVLHAYKLDLALRVRDAGNDFPKLTRLYLETMVKLERFKEWREAGFIRPEIWANDTAAIFHMTYLSGESEKWLRRVLDEFLKFP